MKLVANTVNQTYLRDILPSISEEVQVDYVLAAIAYGNNASAEEYDLIGNALANNLRLDLWMRYDETVPVALPLLKRLYKNLKNNIFTKFVPDCFHAKVIWWKGYGAYIGSANHTDRGWLTNIEAGVFLEEDELSANGMDAQLEVFFDYLKDLDKSIPISKEYIEEMERLRALGKNAYSDAKKARRYPEWNSPSFVNKKVAFDRRKDNFQKEWSSTLGILQSIQEQLKDYRPVWVDETVPPAWQVDQFLHAYYYSQVGEGLSKPYEDYFSSNKSNPTAALKEQLNWWKLLPEAPSNEDRTFYEHAPLIRELLGKDRVLNLSVEELTAVFRKTHATMDHIIKIPMAALGKPEVSYMDKNSRAPLFAELMIKARNQKGWDIRKLLHYVLYGGPDSEVWLRLYHAGRDPSYSIARYGLNSIAEVVGWSRPEVAPPRNGRTSKALRALGYDVKIY